MAPLVLYILLFVAIGAGFIVINLLVGQLLRPNKPQAEKETIYECGEPTIGSAWVQFDLRFYVVALLFVIFDVEVAFFFPWAVVFGKANAISNERGTAEERVATALELSPAEQRERARLVREKERLENQGNVAEASKREKVILSIDRDAAMAGANKDAASKLAWTALWDILVFFGILLVGFAYLWKRGDLQWVRSVSSEAAEPLRHVQRSEAGALVTGVAR